MNSKPFHRPTRHSESRRHLAILQKLAGVFVVLAATIGCWGDMKVAPVSGILTLDGEPVEQASVVFEPQPGGRPSFGVTDAEGKYSLAYSRTLNGAEVGDCLVKISKLEEPADGKPKGKTNEPPVKDAIPKRYLKEPVKVTVLPKRNVIHIDLTSDP